MVKHLSNGEFKNILQKENARIIDVRTYAECNQGVIPGSKHIDIMDHQFLNKVNELPKDGTYLIYCRSGNRSAMACSVMLRNGFQNVYNLGNGIMGWDGDISELSN